MKNQVKMAASENKGKHKAMIRSSYCLAKEGVPNVKFVSLIQLQQANGCPSVQGKTYSHHSSTSEMQDCIAKTLEKEALSDIDKSPFIGVMIDESVNVTVEKKLIIFLRHTKDGEARTTFCGNHTVAAGDAEAV